MHHHTPLRGAARQTARRLALTGAVAAAIAQALWLMPADAGAAEPVPAGLRPLPAAWQAVNPYRGDAEAARIGGSAYEQHCAKCHGADGARSVAEAPDLRRLNSFCKQLRQEDLKPLCLADVDRYYLLSVREGKLRAGLRHMPAWEGVLPQETLWAIRSFTETRPLPAPRVLPELPPGGAPAAMR
jgi:cytochrome c553